MEKLQELVSKCKGGVFINFNHHRHNDESVKDFIKENAPTVFPEMLEVMIAKDTIVNVIFSANNVLESDEVYHHDLEKAIDEALYLVEMSLCQEEKPETLQVSLL